MADKQKHIMKGKKFQWMVSFFQAVTKMTESSESTKLKGAAFCCGFTIPGVTVSVISPIRQQPQLPTENNSPNQKIKQLESEIRQLKVDNGILREKIRKLMRCELNEVQMRLVMNQENLKDIVRLRKAQEEEFRDCPKQGSLLRLKETREKVIKLTQEVNELKALEERKQQIYRDYDDKPACSSNNENAEQSATTSFKMTTNNGKTTLEKEEAGDEVEVISTFYQELDEAANESYNSRDDPDYQQPPLTPSEKSNFVSAETEDSDSFLQSGPTPDDSINVQNAPEEKAEEHGSGRAEEKRPESLLTDEEELKNPTPCEDDYKTPNEEDEQEDKRFGRAQY